MPVTVRFYLGIREVTGVKEITLDPEPRSVRELLLRLKEKFGEKFSELVLTPDSSNVRDNVVLMVNGHSIRLLKGLDTPLKSGDIVTSDVVEITETIGGG